MSDRRIEIDCDLCGSVQKKTVAIEYEYPISRCLNCGFVYVSRIPEVENGKVVGEYYTGDRTEIEAGRKRYEAVTEFLLAEIARLKAPGKLLDVGCGYGFFLIEAGKKGWAVFGTDLSEVAVEYARVQHGLENVYLSDLAGPIFEDKKFDVINLTNVLEHVPSPTKTLVDCRNLLDDRGILMVRVPNMRFNDLKNKILPLLRILGIGKGGDLCYLASPPPVHLAGFSDSTLREYFSKVGLDTIEIKPSKLSAAAQERFVFRLFELSVQLLYKISFRKINLSPTILATALKSV
ncbi:MAG: methyltransferase domain-containing protein [Pyrinomonadaceae bacterium]